MINAAPHIVEVVGPAGAGKSTLCRAMKRADESIHLGNFPDVRKVAEAPFFLWHGLQLSPALLTLSRADRRLSRREFAWLSILHGWPARLKKDLHDYNLIVLDQGPVYLMAELGVSGPEWLKDQQSDNFWRNLVSRWAGVLDTVIWLDAADTDLLDRIRKRDKEHVVKNESDEATRAFLNCYRKNYERIIADLAAASDKLRILRFDTGRDLPEKIIGQISSLA